jgi:aldehyde dehydrogenase (NAD+)
MTIAQEEIFGPVLAIIPYNTQDDAIRIANDSVYAGRQRVDHQ